MHKLEIATFGGGCFWCTEAIFKRLKGVISVTSGYSGDKKGDPSYDQVSTGITSYAEAVQISFNPENISFNTLLDVFWATHDPTTKNRQGNDIGTQYRSIIFYHNADQKKHAMESIKKIEKEKMFKDPIVTEILPFNTFYPAEEYHQNYYEDNKINPYCSIIINPKIKKLLAKFGDKVKEEYK